jgi:hypothetical protein
VEEGVGQLRACLHQVLAVVQHEQQPPGAQSVLQGLQDGTAGFFPNAKRRGRLLRHQGGIGQRRQSDKPRAIRNQPTAVQIARHLEREPGLSHPARTGQG